MESTSKTITEKGNINMQNSAEVQKWLAKLLVSGIAEKCDGGDYTWYEQQEEDNRRVGEREPWAAEAPCSSNFPLPAGVIGERIKPKRE